MLHALRVMRTPCARAHTISFGGAKLHKILQRNDFFCGFFLFLRKIEHQSENTKCHFFAHFIDILTFFNSLWKNEIWSEGKWKVKSEKWKINPSEGESRSFTPVFVVGLAVLLVCFREYITEIGDIQAVGYSCSLARYLRAQAVALRNSYDFWRCEKSLLSLF